jgi:hypothetical protein
MKRIFSGLIMLSVFLLSISSCGNSKKGNLNAMSDMMMDGEVKISSVDGDCAIWIMSTKTSSFAGFYPVNLDEQFKVNGLKIAFNFTDSRAPLPENCNNLKAIVISEVRILK